MKKNVLFFVLLALTLGFFNSCTEDEADAPTLNVTEVAGATYTVGSIVTFEIQMSSNVDLEYFEISPTMVGGTGTGVIVMSPEEAIVDDGLGGFDFEGGLTNVTVTYAFAIPTTLGNGTVVDIEFFLEDADADNSVTKSFTVVSGAGNVDRFTAVLMGAQSNLTIGSYLDANSGVVYTQTDAVTNQAFVDVVYYYGGSNLATICAPDDVTVNGGAGNLTLCESWTTKNGTRFGSSSVSTTEFDAMTDDTLISGITGLTDSKLTDLGVSEVMAFETADGYKGLIKVTDLVINNDGTITIEVVIQK